MNPPEAQSDSEWNPAHFGPEGMDSGEQFFSSSLGNAVRKTPFPADPPKRSAGAWDQERAGRRGHPASGFDPSPLRPLDAVEEKAPAGGGGRESSLDADWRNIVSAKVKRYKRLKPRRERYPSLAFDFDSPASSPLSRVPSAGRVPVQPDLIKPDAPKPPAEARAHARVHPAQEATARVLEFPRPGMLPFHGGELAEPVGDRPRIVEAPELVPAPPALGGILIEPRAEPAPERLAGVDMPIGEARFSKRAAALLLDGILVALALASFPCIFYEFNPVVPGWRTAAELIALFALILWFAYQAAFLIFSGRTPGMRAARLKLARFDGGPVPRNLRIWRVAASILSGISLGLGYAWCFFDEDRLSWHDRITKTHLSGED